MSIAKFKRPRVGIDFHSWSGIYQGSRSHILGIYSEAVSLAPEIDFWFLTEEPQSLASKWLTAQKANVHIESMGHGSGITRLLWQLPRQVSRLELDLLHVQYRCPPLLARKSLVTMHDVLFETHPEFFSRSFVLQSKLTYRFSALMAKRVLTVSDYSKQEIMRHYGLASDRIGVTRNGVDLARFTPVKQATDEAVLQQLDLQSTPYLLAVGRLEPRKNHIALIRAFRLAKLQSCRLVIVGQRDFGYEAIFKEIEAARRENLDVRILESVTDQELPCLMRNALAFAYLPFAEGFGMPPLEAMACGTPVITSNVTSLPEVVGKAGLLVSPTSPEEAARAIESICNDPTLRSSLSRLALNRAQTFQWRNAAEVLVSEIQSCL